METKISDLTKKLNDETAKVITVKARSITIRLLNFIVVSQVQNLTKELEKERRKANNLEKVRK